MNVFVEQQMREKEEKRKRDGERTNEREGGRERARHNVCMEGEKEERKREGPKLVNRDNQDSMDAKRGDMGRQRRAEEGCFHETRQVCTVHCLLAWSCSVGVGWLVAGWSAGPERCNGHRGDGGGEESQKQGWREERKKRD